MYKVAVALRRDGMGMIQGSSKICNYCETSQELVRDMTGLGRPGISEYRVLMNSVLSVVMPGSKLGWN